MRIKPLLLSTFIIAILISCKNKINNDKETDKIENNTKQDYATFKNFPDTAVVNKIYLGEIKYESMLDTNKISKEDSRAIFFFVTTQEGTFNDVESIEKVKHEIFERDKDSIIRFRFFFEKSGMHNFKGIIQDLVILNEYYGGEKSRMITRLTDIEKEIFVKEE